jgi:rhomboid family GlyGly-CTERM serine protease
MKKLPWITLALLAIAILLHSLPQTFSNLCYHRDSILCGEFWRIWTAHIVHLSMEHIIRDGASLLFFGSLLEFRAGRFYFPFILVTALVISSCYAIFINDVTRYGGLSGVISGMCGYLLVLEIPNAWRQRHRFLFICYSTLLVGLVFKIGYEFIYNSSFFYRAQYIKAAPEAHVMGIATGIITGCIQWAVMWNRPLPKIPQLSIVIAIAGALTWVGMVLLF